MFIKLNKAQVEIIEQCWFCKTRQSAKNASYHIPLFSMQGSRTKQLGPVKEISTRYITGAITIPRCYECQTIHEEAQNYANTIALVMTIAGAGLGLGLLVLGLAIHYLKFIDFSLGAIAVIGGGIGGLLIAHFAFRRNLIDRYVQSRNIKPTRSRETYPPLLKILNGPDANGNYWIIGNQPDEPFRWDD